MNENFPIESAGWVIYYYDDQQQIPKFFLIKRHSLAKKIERVAPKWKIEPNEDPKNTVIREIQEETWMKQENLSIWEKLWDVYISLQSEEKGNLEKNIEYYLVKYIWDFQDISVEPVEWYLWYHKWATIQEVSGLIYYENLREVFRKAYQKVR